MMIDVMHYTDYRQFLKDYYDIAKSDNPYFSFQTFSQKAGISSKGLLCNVLRGRRHLSKSHVIGIGQALKLSTTQFEYFENLVAYNCSKKLSDKKYFFERMTALRSTTPDGTERSSQLIQKEQYLFYSQWYHSVIRSLIGLHGYSGDVQQLAKMVRPQIPLGQVKKSVELMERLGLIVHDEKGNYALVNKIIRTAPDVVSLAVFNFHQQTGALALDALKQFPKDKRNFTGVTLGISKKSYAKVEHFRAHLLTIAEEDADADSVYQINFQLFPVSHNRSPRDES
jgi:uncharacterized protein (TIGR02147 family)